MQVVSNVNVVTLDVNGKRLNLKAGKTGDVHPDHVEELLAEGFVERASTPRKKKATGATQTTRGADGEEEDEGKTKKRRTREQLLGSAKTTID